MAQIAFGISKDDGFRGWVAFCELVRIAPRYRDQSNSAFPSPKAARHHAITAAA